MSRNNTASLETRRTSSVGEEEIDLRRLIGILLCYKIHIFVGFMMGLIISTVYALSATPIYQATSLLQVEPKNQSNILKDLNNMLTSQASPEVGAELELVKSRLVLGRTVEALGLDTEVEPILFPAMGKGWYQLNGKSMPELQIGLFRVPNADLNHNARIRIENAKEFIFWADDQPWIKGQIGTILTTPKGYSLLVKSVRAHPGQKFSLQKKSYLVAVNDLGRNLTVAEKGKQTGILSLSFNSDDPHQAQAVLQTVVENYVLQNKEAQAQIAESGLNFIENQLPKIKQSLSEAENQLNAYRDQHATIDVGIEAKGVIESLNLIEQQLTQLKTKEAEMAELFTENHPGYIGLRNQERTLEKAKKDLLERISKMPQTQQDVIRLTRNVDIEQAVYLQLLNKQQELRIQKASNIGNVRIVDAAITADEPIKPRKSRIILLGTLIGGFFAALSVLIRILLQHGISSAEDLENIGIPVFATVPFSEIQSKQNLVLTRLQKVNPNVRTYFLLAADQPADVAVEAIRALRTSIYFAMMDAPNHIVMFSGATPGVGKTFVSVNLAVVTAQSGKRTLLIDADMRKGYVHDMFKTACGTGFSEVLAGTAQAQKTIRSTFVPNLDLLTRGSLPSNPAELLLGEKLDELLQSVSANYDYVILDAPPILAVTDAAILGQYAGNTFLVARFEESSVQDMEACITRFRNSKVEVEGVILNGIKRNASNYHAYRTYSEQYRNAS